MTAGRCSAGHVAAITPLLSLSAQEMRASETVSSLGDGAAPTQEAVSEQLAESRALLESVQVRRLVLAVMFPDAPSPRTSSLPGPVPWTTAGFSIAATYLDKLL